MSTPTLTCEVIKDLLAINGLEVRWDIDHKGRGNWELTVVGRPAERMKQYLIENVARMEELRPQIDEDKMPDIPEANYCFALGEHIGMQRVLNDLYIHIEGEDE